MVSTKMMLGSKVQAMVEENFYFILLIKCLGKFTSNLTNLKNFENLIKMNIGEGIRG